MFDTIHMSIPFVLNHDDEIVLKNDFYIRYNPKWQRLNVHVSIPKLLYGNNIREVTENDIEIFFDTIHKKIHDIFNIEVDQDDWQVYRLDYCKNFIKENQKQVTQSIHNLSKVQLPRKNTVTYNQETVMYQNKSQAIKFYDKYKEMKHNKADEHLLERAKNILRFEIRCNRDILKEYSSKRKATELLTKDVYEQIMNEQLDVINAKMDTIQSENDIDPSLFDVFTYSKLERLYAFSRFLEELGEPFMRAVYDKSYYNRQKDLNEFKDKLEAKRTNRFAI